MTLTINHLEGALAMLNVLLNPEDDPDLPEMKQRAMNVLFVAVRFGMKHNVQDCDYKSACQALQSAVLCKDEEKYRSAIKTSRGRLQHVLKDEKLHLKVETYLVNAGIAGGRQ